MCGNIIMYNKLDYRYLYKITKKMCDVVKKMAKSVIKEFNEWEKDQAFEKITNNQT